jgi:hypothetical protein
MLTPLIITDVTRMSGTRVCVAGIAVDGRSIRPTLPYPGIQEDWLYTNGQCVIRPFSRVTFDLLEHQPQPPHTEDWEINPIIKQFDRMTNNQERRTQLQGMTSQSVEAIFGAEVHRDFGFYIRENEGLRSLGAIQTESVSFVRHYLDDRGNYNYRIIFFDSIGQEYNLAVTDLTFRYYVDRLREVEGLSCGRIGVNLQNIFDNRPTYLRIGLTRPTWEAHPHCCALQITGVYTFPDYLEGRCFADFQPQPPEEEIPF